eukprot:5553762-Pyramimonas_sp.AAC.1
MIICPYIPRAPAYNPRAPVYITNSFQPFPVVSNNCHTTGKTKSFHQVPIGVGTCWNQLGLGGLAGIVIGSHGTH